MSETMQTNDAWVSTTCYGCFPSCAIQVRRKDGKLVASRGDASTYSSLGKCCGKSVSRIADLYHPNRITRPLLRTNPEKGIGVDPKWKEIGWDEALDLVVEKLERLREDDPRKLVLASMDLNNHYFQLAFGKAFQTPNYHWYGATFCGGGLHTALMMTLGTVNSEPDVERCNYIVQWGSQFGLGANNNPMVGIRSLAEARKRGAKLVVVDPICSHAAAKADEWIPIIPGTDGALGLGVANVLVNDLGIYDREFLGRRTNGPYLIADDGQYVRDATSGKPLVWDTAAEQAKSFDDQTIGEYALEGSFEVDGKPCRPAFALLKEHLAKYDTARVSEITSVPEETIRRFAREFGEAARIGATIEYEGQTLPYRPAAIETKRGGTQHKNGFWNVYSIMLPNILVGAMDVPGGLLGTSANGPFGFWRASQSADGLITTDLCEQMGDVADFSTPYPPEPARAPESLELAELTPCSSFRASLPLYTMNDPKKFNLPYDPSFLVSFRFNPMMSLLDPTAVAETLKKMDFMLSFAWQLNETDEFADLVLPESHDYERWWLFPANLPAGYISPGPGPWYGQIVQPVVEPPAGVRHWVDFMTDVAERLGIVAEMNEWVNAKSGLANDEANKLDPDRKYTVEEICKKTVCMLTGTDEYDEVMFRESASAHFYEKTPEEAFPGCFMSGRVPIYFEHFLESGRQVEKVTGELGMDWWDTSYYHALPEWHPCSAHEANGGGYDLYIANSKVPLLSQTITAENPWVDDICKRNPLDHRILLHPSAAQKKGIKDDDTIWVESETNRIKGKVRVTECVHPEVVGTFGIGGRWGKEKNVSRGKGVHYNSLIKFDWNNVDTLSGQMDFCAKVKVYRA